MTLNIAKKIEKTLEDISELYGYELDVFTDLYQLYSQSLQSKDYDYGQDTNRLLGYLQALQYVDIDTYKIENLIFDFMCVTLNNIAIMLTHSKFQELAWKYKDYKEEIAQKSKLYEQDTKNLLQQLNITY